MGRSSIARLERYSQAIAQAKAGGAPSSRRKVLEGQGQFVAPTSFERKRLAHRQKRHSAGDVPHPVSIRSRGHRNANASAHGLSPPSSTTVATRRGFSPPPAATRHRSQHRQLGRESGGAFAGKRHRWWSRVRLGSGRPNAQADNRSMEPRAAARPGSRSRSRSPVNGLRPLSSKRGRTGEGALSRSATGVISSSPSARQNQVQTLLLQWGGPILREAAARISRRRASSCL